MRSMRRTLSDGTGPATRRRRIISTTWDGRVSAGVQHHAEANQLDQIMRTAAGVPSRRLRVAPACVLSAEIMAPPSPVSL